MTPDDDLARAIRSAATPVPPRVGQEPARELLERIVATDRRPTRVPAPARRRRPRLAIAGVAATLAAVGAFALTLVGTGPAYASWTAEPGPISAVEGRDIVARCLPAQEVATARVVIGEKRGDYAYVNAVSPAGSRTCFRDHDGAVRETSILAVLTSTERLGARGAELYGWGQLHTDEGYVRLMAGHVGSQVTGVDITLRTADGASSRIVRATVRDGYFGAWYPEGLDESSSNTTTLTLRLADGSVVPDLSASRLYEQPKLD
ncbi:hypothetical protein [Actinoplanes sp. M2I2]|uniref:hypothetical protein n=1 Tax=Actinoplanes sp. M2I2 TaxID=1734444 RepID=UPI002021FD06|nr:hypothetical protein [Actinoplanes sp. M2I2]